MASFYSLAYLYGRAISERSNAIIMHTSVCPHVCMSRDQLEPRLAMTEHLVAEFSFCARLKGQFPLFEKVLKALRFRVKLTYLFSAEITPLMRIEFSLCFVDL